MGELIIPADQLQQRDVRTAPWRDEAPEGVAALLRELLAAGTVDRWRLLAGALELTRREAAAEALEAAAIVEARHHSAAVAARLKRRAELHRSGDL